MVFQVNGFNFAKSGLISDKSLKGDIFAFSLLIEYLGLSKVMKGHKETVLETGTNAVRIT